MTRLGRLLAFFPAFHLASIVGAVLAFAMSPGLLSLLLIPAAVYLLPLAAHRLHGRVFPLIYGRSDLGLPTYSPWWGSYNIQSLFIAVPWLEAILRVVPGVYSSWLRLWGSKVGKSVVWTPLLDVTDRATLDIGDRVVLGHESKFLSHYVRKTDKGRLELLVEPIVIGTGALIGAGSRLAPGVVIGEGARLNILTDVHPRACVAAGAHTAEREIVRAVGRSTPTADAGSKSTTAPRPIRGGSLAAAPAAATFVASRPVPTHTASRDANDAGAKSTTAPHPIRGGSLAAAPAAATFAASPPVPTHGASRYGNDAASAVTTTHASASSGTTHKPGANAGPAGTTKSARDSAAKATPTGASIVPASEGDAAVPNAPRPDTAASPRHRIATTTGNPNTEANTASDSRAAASSAPDSAAPDRAAGPVSSPGAPTASPTSSLSSPKSDAAASAEATTAAPAQPEAGAPTNQETRKGDSAGADADAVTGPSASKAGAKNARRARTKGSKNAKAGASAKPRKTPPKRKPRRPPTAKQDGECH